MKNRFLAAMLLLLGLSLNAAVAAAPHAAAAVDKLAGIYALYVFDKPDAGVQGHMTIAAWGGDSFLVHGQDWVGLGKLTGTRGYYDWKLDDGRSGRTDLEVDGSGSIKGHVHGSGIDWTYLARRRP